MQNYGREAYGVIKRTNEIVEELLKQIDATAQSRNETREQMEQRNYEIAIEVSQLEATISGLWEEVAKKTAVVENLGKTLAEKEGKASDIEREMTERLNKVENEASELRQLVHEYDDKLRSSESTMESQRPLLIDQLNLVSRIHEQIYDVIRIVDVNNLDHSELSESLFLPQETDMEENIRAALAGMESIYELSRIIVGKTRDIVEVKNIELKSLDETVGRLVTEKEHIGSLLRSALSNRMTSDPSSKANALFQVAENGLREAGIDFKFSKLLEDGKVPTPNDRVNAPETEGDEIYTLAGALEKIVKASQLEIIELQHSVDELRAESSLLKEHVDVQAKELNHRMHRIEELEEKERVATLKKIRPSDAPSSRWTVFGQSFRGSDLKNEKFGELMHEAEVMLVIDLHLDPERTKQEHEDIVDVLLRIEREQTKSSDTGWFTKDNIKAILFS
ncbi:hypothetical protein CJ030_MR5G015880 [Morella rubra]|uniref:Uncharacterized protein n=1 Tax=Morella rubra TaxID=262757 RepID=A0A6A1VJN5_9ROSI|nr:hypothetical protein CJ030_MR5G015880 [Morella rubra]